jgi:phosphatidylglycerol phospholipase C
MSEHAQIQSPLHEGGHTTKTPVPTSAHSFPGLPQIISHRGYKGKFPENTLAAVQGAVQAGTHALEIDLHLSRDGVLVLSHDPTLQRCYGIKKKIGDCDWEYLKTLRTLQAPYEPMPRFVDILEFLRQPGHENIWALLDIKVTNDPETIMSRIAQTIASTPLPPSSQPWHKRLILGCWSAHYLPLRDKYLPTYEMTLISFDLNYARQYLHTPNISFNINQRILMGPFGRGFLDEARAANAKVYLWTVNAPNLMRWGIRRGVEGIITDDPALYKRVCEVWEREGKDGVVFEPELQVDSLSVGQRAQIWMVAVLVVLFGWVIRRKYLLGGERVRLEERKVT